jgi:hypothetical protein
MATPTWRRRAGSTLSPLPTAKSSSVLAATAPATGPENWRVVRSRSRALSASASAHPLESRGPAVPPSNCGRPNERHPWPGARRIHAQPGPCIRDDNGRIGRCGDDPPADSAPRTAMRALDWRTVSWRSQPDTAPTCSTRSAQPLHGVGRHPVTQRGGGRRGGPRRVAGRDRLACTALRPHEHLAAVRAVPVGRPTSSGAAPTRRSTRSSHCGCPTGCGWG